MAESVLPFRQSCADGPTSCKELLQCARQRNGLGATKHNTALWPA